MEAEINIFLSLLQVYVSESLQLSVCVCADVTAWHLSCRFSSSLCVLHKRNIK